jgi:hypothetical protein
MSIGIYQRALDDLEQRRERCLEDLKKIDAAITGLRAAMGVAVNLAPFSQDPSIPSIVTTKPEEVVDLSVRRAVLRLLAQNPFAMTTAFISDSLLKLGNGTATRPNVSAVLSDMKKTGEIEPSASGGGYMITKKGSLAARYLFSSQPKER